MGILDATKNYFLKWNDFKSRIPRSEYWWGLLSIYVITFSLGYIVGFIVGYFGTMLGFSFSSITIFLNVLLISWSIFTIIAGLSLVARRLHDVNRSGWWYLIVFTIIGIFVVLYWLCKKGDEEENQFGPDPLAVGE